MSKVMEWRRLFENFMRPKISVAPFHHPVLGAFDFVQDVGWEKSIELDGRRVELNLGSNGEMPNQSMLDCLQYWIGNWVTRRSEINEYMMQEGRSWYPHDTTPDASQLLLDSIEILWPEKPWTCMVYLELPDDERHFHVTFDGRVPIGFAYDH